MPLTYTGRLVRPGGTEHPSLIDIAVGLSRQPRFAGQGRSWWSVLDHTLFCDELVMQQPLPSPRLRLAVLLHDAHEAITADVPTDVKGEDMKAYQKLLDVVIQDAYFPGGRHAYLDYGWAGDVQRIDRRALCAEAQVVGPPVEKQRILELFGVCEETVEDVTALRLKVGTGIWGVPPVDRHNPEANPAVQEYLRRMLKLL